MTHPTPDRLRRYALLALAGTPAVMHPLLDGILPSEADFRPDPDRFTIREALCHLADWEPIWLERLHLVAASEPGKELPYLRGYDEGQIALDRHYSESKLWDQAARFTDGRRSLAAFVETVPVESWAKVGEHGEMGPITFAELVMLILAHDGYHLRQFAEFRKAAAR